MDVPCQSCSNLTEVTEREQRRDLIVSDQVLEQLSFINFVILTGSVSFLGVMFNLINISVFWRLGFKDPLNITLFSLSIADTGALLPLVWISVCNNPLVEEKLSYLDVQGVQHLTAGWPHVCFSRIAGLLTAFITFERHLCVALPLKAKNIITHRRRVIVVVVIFVVMVVGVVPTYFGAGLGPVFNSDTNRTKIGLVYYKHGTEIENVAILFSAFTQLLAFVVVTISTLGLVQVLRQKSKWRQSMTRPNQSSALSSRDAKAVRLVITIATIFITSYLPICASLIGMLSYKEFTMVGVYRNLLLACATIFFCLEAINSSVNFFVYIAMNAKYREMCLSVFKRDKV